MTHPAASLCKGCEELSCNMAFMLGKTYKEWTPEERKILWDFIHKYNSPAQHQIRAECECICHNTKENHNCCPDMNHSKTATPPSEKCACPKDTNDNLWHIVDCPKSKAPCPSDKCECDCHRHESFNTPCFKCYGNYHTLKLKESPSPRAEFGDEVEKEIERLAESMLVLRIPGERRTEVEVAKAYLRSLVRLALRGVGR